MASQDDDASDSDDGAATALTAIVDDVLKCRRLVASMRGMVLAVSTREQMLRDVVLAATAAAQERQQQRTKEHALASPRQRYLQVRLEKLVLSKLAIERVWRAKRGVKRFEASALVVQRIFRGFWARKHMHKRLSIFDVALKKHTMSKIETLRATCAAYNEQAHRHKRDLQQTIADLETTRTSRARTESTIAATATKAVTYIDATLLDGTAVRMEAHQLLLHQTNEIERLDAMREALEVRVAELARFDPGADQAARILQSSYKVHRQRMHLKAKQQQRRLTRARLRVSKEQCYERMNAQLQARHAMLWASAASTISSLYYIAQAKILMHRYRQQRAARKIWSHYRLMQLRVQAKARRAWLGTKRRARAFLGERVAQHLRRVWCAWRAGVDREKTRRALIAQRVEQGLAMWLTTRALRLQRLHRIAMARRSRMTEQLATQLDPVVLHTLDVLARKHAATATLSTIAAKRGLCSAFYEQLLHDVSTWHEPPAHMFVLARRYELELETLPRVEIRTWLELRQQRVGDAMGFLDLLQPFPTRTLAFLAQVSLYYALADRVTSQCHAIAVELEVRMVMRAYLRLLYTHNQVQCSHATTYAAQQRLDAVLLLQQKDNDESMEIADVGSERLRLRGRGRASAFTSFHCVWSDLCEKCLMLQPSCGDDGIGASGNAQHLDRACGSCGHRRADKSTAAAPSYAAFQPTKRSARHTSESSADTPAAHEQLVSDDERCDYFVLNAYFHALAPLGHANREEHAPQTLWKLALAHATASVAMLYEQLRVVSLNTLLARLRRDLLRDAGALQPTRASAHAWASVAPPQVLAVLARFADVFVAEQRAIEQALQPERRRRVRGATRTKHESTER